MPSPFPGMDPYLERPDLWPDVHGTVINTIRELLVSALPPTYMARVEITITIDYRADPDNRTSVRPDVGVVERTPPASAPYLGGSSPPAVLSAPLHLTNILSELEMRQRRVEIRTIADERLVTVIELLSPANKHGPGHDEYAEKRGNYLQRNIHLMELDLLRKGRRIILLDPLPDAAYFVFLSRADRRPTCEVWPLQLNDPLPFVPVPLLAGDADLALNLGEVLQTAYDRAGYARMLDYTADPIPPLTDEQATWANSLLRKQGMRPT
ncbi:MAG: DUF4058 family protein [Anaerolineae bacterium]|nr:DUF4058 family protein [Anaerolineae bacterium]